MSFEYSNSGFGSSNVNWSTICFSNIAGIHILIIIAEVAAIRELKKLSLLLCTKGVSLSIVLKGML